MSGQPAGRIALITGANRGIGVAIAKGYAREGAQCILAARNLPALSRVADEIKAACGKATALLPDLENPDSIQAAVG